jgi:hypothetical protein
VAQTAWAWAPFIALGCGVLAGLGTLHSVKRAVALALALSLVQMVAWIAILLTERPDPPGDWNTDLWAGFLLGLIVVTPYTTIGAVASATAVGLLCPKARRTRAGFSGPPHARHDP